jgi:hypothetical protein
MAAMCTIGRNVSIFDRVGQGGTIVDNTRSDGSARSAIQTNRTIDTTVWF